MRALYRFHIGNPLPSLPQTLYPRQATNGLVTRKHPEKSVRSYENTTPVGQARVKSDNGGSKQAGTRGRRAASPAPAVHRRASSSIGRHRCPRSRAGSVRVPSAVTTDHEVDVTLDPSQAGSRVTSVQERINMVKKIAESPPHPCFADCAATHQPVPANKRHLPVQVSLSRE